MPRHSEYQLDGKYITTSEFAARMGWKTLRNVYFAIEAGRINGAIKIGRSWLIPATSIARDLRKERSLKLPKNK